MLRFVIGTFIILHGLVHLWYFTLSQSLVAFQPAMGWTGRSWIFSNILGNSTTRSLASVLYVLAALAFVVSGVDILIRQEWLRPVLMGAAILSAATIFFFWDGSGQLLVEKGLLGLLIDAVILVSILLFTRQLAAAF